MGAVAISFALVFLCVGLLASSSGEFYRKISGEDDAEVSTAGFHQCSLQNNCKLVGIPISSIDSRVYSAPTMQELEATDKKMQVWQKIQPKASSKVSEAATVKVFRSCREALKAGVRENGTVRLSLTNNTVDVYCDMSTDGGGWIVFQRRVNTSVSFEKNWTAYENGFGNLKSNFWLGLKTLHGLSSTGNWILRIDLKANDGSWGYAKYTKFFIKGSQDKYRLKFDEYSGNIGNALRVSQGWRFTTLDNDNDDKHYNCAIVYKGGWWHNACFDANLNSWYPGTRKNGSLPEMEMGWKTWKTDFPFGNIVFSEMKMKEES